MLEIRYRIFQKNLRVKGGESIVGSCVVNRVVVKLVKVAVGGGEHEGSKPGGSTPHESCEEYVTRSGMEVLVDH